MDSSVGYGVVSNFSIPLTGSSSIFRNACQQSGFAWQALRLPVLSAPLKAWNAGRAAALACPRALLMGSGQIS